MDPCSRNSFNFLLLMEDGTREQCRWLRLSRIAIGLIYISIAFETRCSDNPDHRRMLNFASPTIKVICTTDFEHSLVQNPKRDQFFLFHSVRSDRRERTREIMPKKTQVFFLCCNVNKNDSIDSCTWKGCESYDHIFPIALKTRLENYLQKWTTTAVLLITNLRVHLRSNVTHQMRQFCVCKKCATANEQLTVVAIACIRRTSVGQKQKTKS